nr:PREDICTED: uncharacterized protein LOC109625371 [Paralichthys olivaceus]
MCRAQVCVDTGSPPDPTASRGPGPRGGPRCLTSPPVLLGDVFPRELLVQVLAALHDVRLLDKFPPAAVLQHHLQLREFILALQAPLVKQRPAPHHVAGGGFPDFSLGVAGRPRCVRLPFIGQVADDRQVALLTRHVSAEPRPPSQFRVSLEEGGTAVRYRQGDWPEQTKWLLHNRMLRQHRRKHIVPNIHRKRAWCPNLQHHRETTETHALCIIAHKVQVKIQMSVQQLRHPANIRQRVSNRITGDLEGRDDAAHPCVTYQTRRQTLVCCYEHTSFCDSNRRSGACLRGKTSTDAFEQRVPGFCSTTEFSSSKS